MAWLETSLIQGPRLALVLSKKAYQRAGRDSGVKKSRMPPWLDDGQAQATTSTLEGGKLGLSCIVSMGRTKGLSGIDIAAVLVHESVHVFQSYCDFVGEDAPSAEFQAYATEMISRRLMEAFVAQRPKALARR